MVRFPIFWCFLYVFTTLGASLSCRAQRHFIYFQVFARLFELNGRVSKAIVLGMRQNVLVLCFSCRSLESQNVLFLQNRSRVHPSVGRSMLGAWRTLGKQSAPYLFGRYIRHLMVLRPEGPHCLGGLRLSRLQRMAEHICFQLIVGEFLSGTLLIQMCCALQCKCYANGFPF